MTGAKRWLANWRGQDAVSTGRTSISLAILTEEDDSVLSATCRARVSTAASAARDVKRTALLVSAISAERAEEKSELKERKSFHRKKGRERENFFFFCWEFDGEFDERRERREMVKLGFTIGFTGSAEDQSFQNRELDSIGAQAGDGGPGRGQSPTLAVVGPVVDDDSRFAKIGQIDRPDGSSQNESRGPPPSEDLVLLVMIERGKFPMVASGSHRREEYSSRHLVSHRLLS
ncbi:hypothetical protein K0M31_004202 [Melipona bicolor]|uniref:Uncharacterized protein n=1 Tax=Melipona bicolor TaxID=60889 RepID=A0AA40FWA8_9HYME|nr:hypothetical protein K0M31_004202 [Melipona bicolor]